MYHLICFKQTKQVLINEVNLFQFYYLLQCWLSRLILVFEIEKYQLLLSYNGETSIKIEIDIQQLDPNINTCWLVAVIDISANDNSTIISLIIYPKVFNVSISDFIYQFTANRTKCEAVIVRRLRMTDKSECRLKRGNLIQCALRVSGITFTSHVLSQKTTCLWNHLHQSRYKSKDYVSLE